MIPINERYNLLRSLHCLDTLSTSIFRHRQFTSSVMIADRSRENYTHHHWQLIISTIHLVTNSIYQGEIDWQCSISLNNLGQIKTLNRKIVALRQFLTEDQFPRNINNFNLNPQYKVSLAYYHTILALENVRKFPIIIGHQNDFNVFLWCLGCYEDNLDQPYGL